MDANPNEDARAPVTPAGDAERPPGRRANGASPHRASPVERLVALLRAHDGLVLVWLALSLIVLLPIWNQRLLPMLDTPNHLALVRGWHNFHDPAYRIAEFYELRLRPVPYLLYYGALHLLMFVVHIEVANKLFLSAYLILFPLSVLALGRALGRSPWLATGGFLLAFNQNWIYGFSSYLMSTAFLFFSLALLIRWLDRGRPWQVALLGLTCLCTYFGHILAWFCLGLCTLVLLALDWRRWRRGLVAAAVMLPTLPLAVWAILGERSDNSYIKGGKFTGFWHDFPDSVALFPKRVMELFPGHLDMAALATLALTIVVALLLRRGLREGQELAARGRLKWMLLVLGVAYLALPYNVTRPFSWWYIAPRLPGLMAVLLLLLPDVRLEGRRRFLMLPVLVMAVVLPLTLARLYRDFSRRNAGFIRLVTEVPRGATVMVVYRGMNRGPGSEEKSGDPVTSAPVYWHFSSWPMALHGGYSPYLFDQGFPIRPRQKLPAPIFLNDDNFDIRQAPSFQYYLVRQPHDAMFREPSLKLLDSAGEWNLFQRIHELTDEP
jgi:hypothetical protein